MAQPIAANIYGYHPSLLAAFTFMVLYGIVALYHCHLCVFVPFRRPKKHRYTIPVLIAALCFTAGYGGRIASIRDTTSVLLYAVSSCLIVVAPIFVCATLYLLVANLIRDCLPQWHQVSLGVSPRWIGRIFVTSDILSFITQGSGSAIAASSKWTGSGRTIGINILPIGLMLQVITFSFFLILTWRFVSRVKKSAETSFNPFIKQVLRGVWIAGALIEIRSVYHTIEFGLGVNGYPFSHEWMLYAFEAMPMLIALSALAWYHPVKWLQQKSRFRFTSAIA